MPFTRPAMQLPQLAAVLSLTLAAAGHCQTPTPAPAKQAAPAIAVGNPAPDFRLNDASGRLTKVGGESSTWTVLAFYPKASTPG